MDNRKTFAAQQIAKLSAALLLTLGYATVINAGEEVVAEASISIQAPSPTLEKQDSSTLQKMAILKLIDENRQIKKRLERLENRISAERSNLYRIKSFGANQRNKPGMDGNVTRMYRRGDIVHVDSFIDGWAKLDNGGYVYGSLLEPY